MRVIAGRYGGRRLSAPRGRATRPTSERVREALFSQLADVTQARVLDLFAGTGALGIEALSRGARSALFVERDANALRSLRANLKALCIESESARVLAGDALAALHSARARGETYDLVFVDPPYGRARELGEALREILPALLAPGARVVVEADRRAPAELDLPIAAQRRYGDTTITIHRQHTTSQ
jgi:16S rRNA (guanine966-N2)-methyltransferase